MNTESTTSESIVKTSNLRVLTGIIRSARPQQWIKNLFVLAPLFFSTLFLEAKPLALGLGAMMLFCFAASAVYLLNDIFDIEKDRNHPVKQLRPIASGETPIRVAWAACAILASISVGVGMAIDWRLGAVLSSYLVMNLAYSTVLKHIPFVDVIIIATGFVLRVLAGAFAIDVYISEWLFGCTFLLSLYLGLGKRQHEMAMLKRGEASKVRKVLERYHPDHLEFAFLFVAGLTIACYTVYTLTASLPDQPLRTQKTPFASPYLPATIPFTVFGITRFYQLVNNDSPYSPTDLILKDWPFILNLVLWVGCAGALVLTN